VSTPTPGRPGTLGLPTDREDAGALLAVGQVSDHREDEVTTRVASAADAPVIAEILAEAFEGYRAWAPPEWSPPSMDGEEAFLAVALSRSDVWFLLARAHGKAVGHVALSPFTMVQQQPPPAGTINLWQLFVRPPWQGRGVATELMRAAGAEARRRGFTRMRLWTPRDAARARRFYEREGWTATESTRGSALVGLPLVQYARALTGAS
jgi:GNAT superfamily N-acetyltransferase